jgi:hypothetical protein
MHRHQFLIALYQMRHAPFGDLDSPSEQFLMDFGHTAMLPKPQGSYQSNHIQTKFSMR